MLEDQNVFEKWKRQNEFLEKAKTDHPELFVKSEQIESSQVLGSVGISLPAGELPLGYLKYSPFDFIVEEIQQDGKLCTVDYDSPLPPPEGEGNTVFCDLVKIGLPTTEATKEIAKRLAIESSEVGRAGLKDAVALTSQRISIRGVTVDAVVNLPRSNFFVKNISLGTGLLDAGNLTGNRFTIFVRTDRPVDRDRLQKKLEEISESGFWNFYWLQRFGSRLLSHWWGALIMRGDYQGAVKSFLCDSSLRDIPFYRHLRHQAEQRFGDWEAMKQVFQPLHYTLRHELAVLEHLSRYRFDYVGALQKIPDQVQLWIYAYTSYQANLMLSLASKTSTAVPETLPLGLSYDKADRRLYQRFFTADGISDSFEKHLRPFNIRMSSRGIKVKILPKIHSYSILPEGVALCFDLPKGAYATTFFAHFFTLTGGMPMPGWLKKTEYDTKELLDTGSLAKIREIFKDYTVVKEEDLELPEAT